MGIKVAEFQMEKELQAYGFLMRWKIQMKAQIYVSRRLDVKESLLSGTSQSRRS